MRNTNDNSGKDLTCWFVDDTPTGCWVSFNASAMEGNPLDEKTGTWIYMDTSEMNGSEPFYSPISGREVFYPGWAEW